jgi:hypothetical protein
MKHFVAAFFVACAFGQDIRGVVDLHAHSAPDATPRSIDGIRLAKIAAEAGLRGMVLKNHYEPTAGLAELAAPGAPGLEVLAGVALNRPAGGVNVAAVEYCLKVSKVRCRVVWMPTFDAEHHVKGSGERRPYVSVSRGGKLLPETLEVLDAIAKNDMVLATGHSSPAESLLLIREAKRRGVKRIIVTHPTNPFVGMTIEQARTAAREGAYLEFTGNGVYGVQKHSEFADYVRDMRAVGIERAILSSDFGQVGNPLHPEGWSILLRGFLEAGFTAEEWDRVAKRNPAELLGLK